MKTKEHRSSLGRAILAGLGCLFILAAPARAQTIPNAPTNLAATVVSANQINLSWTDVSTNEDGFKIERSTDGTNFTQIAQVLPNTTVYLNTGLWPATTYSYRVRAYNSGDDSDFSNVASASTPVLCAPTSVIGWGNNVFGQITPPPGLTNVVAIAAGEFHGLAVNEDHTVIGWGRNDLGQATPPAGLTGVVAIAAGGFFNASMTIGGHSLALKSDGTVVGWGNNANGQATPPAGLTGVVAISAGGFHSLALKSDGTVVGWGNNSYGQATTPAGLSNVVAIAAGGFHNLAVRSDGTVVGWGWNSFGYATPPAGATGVVAVAAGQDFSLVLKGNGTVLGWGNCPYGQCSPPSGLNGVVAIAAAAQHALALKSDGTVVAWGYDGYGQSTPPGGLTGLAAVACGEYFSLALQSALSAPSALTATAVSSNQINLSWTDNSDNEDGFKIERAPDNGGVPGTWAQIAVVSSNITAYGDTGLSENVKYWYRVRAFNAGRDSYYSNQASTTIPLPPAAPSNLTAVTANQINLSWTDNAYNEDGFKIERAPDNAGSPGAWALVATVAANVTNYNDTGLSPGTTYWYRVRAYNVSGDSDYSNQASAITPPLLTPSALIATAISTNQINLSWTDNSDNEDGFKIERAQDVAGNPVAWTQIATVGVNTATYNDTGLPANKKYWYRVRAYNAQGNSNYSNQASATTPALCPRLVVGWGNSSIAPPAGLEWVIAIAAGDFHALALKSDGTVVGWGNSYYATPPAGLSNVVAISAQYEHSLVLKSDGTVTNWGYGPPTPPAGLSNVIAIAAGSYHDLALKANGTVVSWGSAQTPPAGLSNVVAIAAGNYNGLALKSDGTVVSWGGSTPPGGLTNVVAIAAGSSQCLALKSNGTIVSWGGGPTPPAGLSNVVAISAGSYYCLALKSDGTVVGWGGPTPPAGLTRVVAIAAAGNYSGLALTMPCSFSAPSALTATAVSASQINLAWLDNSPDENGFKIERSTDGTNFTQIAQVLPNTTSYRNTGLWPGTTYYYRVRPYNSGGDWDPSNVASAGTPAQCLTSIAKWGNGPMPPPNLTNVVAIAAGSSFYDLALKSDGTVVGWGGQTPPAGLSNVVAIAAGSSHGLALKSDGTVVGWGNPPPATVPAGLSNVVAIAAGFSHSLALKSDGTVVGWGINSYGQTNCPAGLSSVVAIAAGYYHNLALKCDGTVVGWGRNDYGQATPPAALRAVTAIAAGYNHSLALTSYGTIVGWGSISYGKSTPPAGLTSVVGIGAGYSHSLALKSNGTVVAWGDNSYSQTNIPAGLSGVVAIAAGQYHSLAMSCAPSAPSALGATAVAASQINLGWTDNSKSEDRFGIERATSYTGPWTEIGSADFNVTTYSDTGVGCGHTYFYRVRAYNAMGGSPYSSIAYTDTSAADSDSDGMTDCWTLQYFGHPTGQESDHSRATDDADGDGLTNLQEFQAGTDPTIPAPAAPSGLTATAVSTNQIDLSWTDNASTEDGFKIDRAPDDGGRPGTWTQIATTSSNVTTYSDTGLAPNRTYWYRVVAYNAGGELGSNEANATTPCAPFDPTIITTPPSSQVVCPGETATFSVGAIGSSLTYQWRKNGMDLTDSDGISGANTATLTISNALPGWGGICDTVMGTDGAGKAFGDVVAGQTYGYQAIGCVMYAYGGYVNPSGLLSTNGCSTLDIPGVVSDGNPPFICPGLTNWSLVGKVGDNCIQLGRSGCFVAPASGTLTLYCNDQTGLLGDNGGSWNVCVSLGSEGVYDVVVTGVCGSQVSSGAVLKVNSTPGCMTLVATSPPDYGYTIDSNVTVAGKASAGAGLNGVTVNLVGATSADGFTNWTASVSGLAVGTNTLVVIATDQAVPAHTLTNVSHVIYASGAYDGNGDALPDVWQVQYFGSVNSLNAAPTADPDGDGMSNLQEYLAGTDPTNSLSVLRITAIAQEGDDMRVTWTMGNGKTNALQATAGDDGGGFTNTFTDLFIVTNTVGTVTNYLDAGGATNSPARYYRVRLVP
ncbi:MAG: fibronectin type III domain-containing protein [Verrucomicrobiia bacterium]